MVDLHGFSANMENLLRICSGPTNRLKETVHSSPYCKSSQTYKIMVGVTFNTINIYICIVVRSFYHNKVKFDFYTTLLRLTFIWYLVLKFYVVLFPSPVGKVRNNKIEN